MTAENSCYLPSNRIVGSIFFPISSFPTSKCNPEPEPCTYILVNHQFIYTSSHVFLDLIFQS